MPTPLSVYILTHNSERRLAEVLDAATEIADEIIVVDSGSSDSTEEILKRYPVHLLHRTFDNFRDQRIFAESACSNAWVLAIDSDEVLSSELIDEIRKLKENDFLSAGGQQPDGFEIRRDWYFLNRQVRNFYPVRTPEFIVRLFQKDKISTKGSRIIHEALQVDGCNIGTIRAPIKHYSCDSIDDLYGKIGLYTRLMAEDMHAKGERASWVKIHLYPWLIWGQWYFLRGSWRDGEAGIVLSRYVRITVYLKYLKLKFMAVAKPGQ